MCWQLSNWSLVYENEELGLSISSLCKNLRENHTAWPPPSTSAVEMLQLLQSRTAIPDFVPGTDFSAVAAARAATAAAEGRGATPDQDQAGSSGGSSSAHASHSGHSGHPRSIRPILDQAQASRQALVKSLEAFGGLVERSASDIVPEAQLESAAAQCDAAADVCRTLLHKLKRLAECKVPEADLQELLLVNDELQAGFISCWHNCRPSFEEAC